MNPLFYEIALIVLGCILSVLLTFYFTTRNSEQKMNKIAEEVVKEAVATHNEIKHQNDMYSYFKEKLGEHYNGCGAAYASSLKTVENKLQHMELKEVKNSMILLSISKTISTIAKKMKITDVEIPTDIDKDET
jgi:hypothetical protein